MDIKTIVPGIFKAGEGVLINKDNKALAAYKSRKDKDKKIEFMSLEVQELKNDINEIKTIVKELLEHRNKVN